MSSIEAQLEQLRRSQEQILTSTKRSLWQAPEELNESWEATKARRGKEFSVLPEESEKEDSSSPFSLSRRNFLQWVGAAAAAMTTTACQRRPVDTIVPYVKKPMGLIYGVPVWYSSTAANGYGVLVKTREGRPIKLEGNPDHPVNQGGLDSQTQASILDLYNPERLKGPVMGQSQKPATWKEAHDAVKKALSDSEAGSVRLLTGPIVSPSLRSTISDFVSAHKAKHHVVEDAPTDPILRAHEVLTGQKVVPTYRFEKADIIVSVDADFLGSWLRSVENTKAFSKRRKIHHGDKNVNRLFVFESTYSITGVAADERFAITPSQQLKILMALAALVSRSASVDPSLKSVLNGVSVEKVSKELGLRAGALEEIASALLQAKGRSLIVAGGRGPDALEVQMAALGLNQMLQNISATLDYESAMVTGMETGDSFSSLVQDMNAGRVSTLIVRGANPVYSHPGSDFHKALSKVKLVVTVTPEFNETAAASHYALGESHYLEAWGDSEIREGVYSIQQPVIEPLYETHSLGELLATWNGSQKVDYRDVVQNYWRKNVFSGAGNFGSWWDDQLRVGAIASHKKSRSLGFHWASVTKSLETAMGKAGSDSLEIVLYQSMNLRDGTQANNAWLQEIPDPMTKVCWGNYAAISPELAQTLKLKSRTLPNQNQEILRLHVNGEELKLPAVIQPGLHPRVIAVALGYGRSKAGTIGTHVGENAYILAASRQDGEIQFSGQKVEAFGTGSRTTIVSTQKAFELQGRDEDILHQMTLAEFLKNPRSAKEKESEDFSIYKEPEFVYPLYKWGMSIDLNTCTGCQACVVACYSENNIPVVGPDQIDKGRHMAWMRIDLYYSGDLKAPEAAFEPMLCQQCSKAPCETVCPVLATTHSDDGLNDMVYNRCVGTRYCSNNCPYKVRHFNYFAYSDALAGKLDGDPLPMMLNPDVTVRSRGVMEKCTFCTQRIRRVADDYKDKKMRVPDGAIKTACQQSCPADAITFGDLNDPNSQVAKHAAQVQAFKVLEVLNTRPSISYFPRIRNKGNTQA